MFSIGHTAFKNLYKIKYPYVVGSMYKGISSVEMVTALAQEHIMSYFGTGGLPLERVEESIIRLITELGKEAPFGMNLLCNTHQPIIEEETVAIFLKKGITKIEASAFATMTKSIVWFRASGLEETYDGNIISKHLIQGKLSRPEVATHFLKPAPERLLKELVNEGKITTKQATLAKQVPMADCICVEADSGGHTDSAIAQAILPTVIRQRDRMVKEYQYKQEIFIGAAGGIGTPEAAAAMFMLGADYIQTGSINQCTIEAGNSDVVKDMLEKVNVQDTALAPAGDMFEIGAKVQVLKKGVFFPLKANKLYEVYKQFSSIEAIDHETRKYLEEKIFKKTLDEIEKETRAYHTAKNPNEIKRMDDNPKVRMARIFQWYFGFSNRVALAGQVDCKTDFQVFCGPALGACNQWLKDSPYESWRNRYVAELSHLLMKECEKFMKKQITQITQPLAVLEEV